MTRAEKRRRLCRALDVLQAAVATFDHPDASFNLNAAAARDDEAAGRSRPDHGGSDAAASMPLMNAAAARDDEAAGRSRPDHDGSDAAASMSGMNAAAARDDEAALMPLMDAAAACASCSQAWRTVATFLNETNDDVRRTVVAVAAAAEELAAFVAHATKPLAAKAAAKHLEHPASLREEFLREIRRLTGWSGVYETRGEGESRVPGCVTRTREPLYRRRYFPFTTENKVNFEIDSMLESMTEPLAAQLLQERRTTVQRYKNETLHNRVMSLLYQLRRAS